MLACLTSINMIDPYVHQLHYIQCLNIFLRSTRGKQRVQTMSRAQRWFRKMNELFYIEFLMLGMSAIISSSLSESKGLDIPCFYQKVSWLLSLGMTCFPQIFYNQNNYRAWGIRLNTNLILNTIAMQFNLFCSVATIATIPRSIQKILSM